MTNSKTNYAIVPELRHCTVRTTDYVHPIRILYTKPTHHSTPQQHEQRPVTAAFDGYTTYQPLPPIKATCQYTDLKGTRKYSSENKITPAQAHQVSEGSKVCVTAAKSITNVTNQETTEQASPVTEGELVSVTLTTSVENTENSVHKTETYNLPPLGTYASNKTYGFSLQHAAHPPQLPFTKPTTAVPRRNTPPYGETSSGSTKTKEIAHKPKKQHIKIKKKHRKVAPMICSDDHSSSQPDTDASASASTYPSLRWTRQYPKLNPNTNTDFNDDAASVYSSRADYGSSSDSFEEKPHTNSLSLKSLSPSLSPSLSQSLSEILPNQVPCEKPY